MQSIGIHRDKTLFNRLHRKHCRLCGSTQQNCCNGKHNNYTARLNVHSMVRISTIVIVLAIVLAIGLIPIPVIPGVGLLVGISGIVIGVILRLLGL